MRVKKFDDRVIYLTEKERRELLKRFDLSKVVKKGELYQIPGDGCYLCKKYRKGEGSCGGCPLDSEVDTCGDLMEVIVGDAFTFHADVNSGVNWIRQYDTEARIDVRKIHKALISMKRVWRRGR